MSKSVGILTFHAVNNLGAVLQAFALQRTVVALGHTCSVIDYRDPEDDAYRLFRPPRSVADLYCNGLALLGLPSHVRSRRRFDRFRLGNLSMTKRRYGSAAELAAGSESFDVYVSGSDQVWRPMVLESPSASVYFQDFVRSGRRVAYAASFGVATLPEHLHDRARRSLERFDFLSSREDTGCAIIRTLTGRDAEHVLDPTLLRTSAEYDLAAVDPPLDGPFILLYPMQWSESLRDLALKARAQLGMPIVALLTNAFSPWRFSFADRIVYDAGPAEFLGWLRRSRFVCTNSFHGTCFSVVYRKDFIGVPHQGTGSRAVSLLSRLGLLSRLRGPDREVALDEDLAAPIDYGPVEGRLQQAIEGSLTYLRRALA